MTTTDDSLLLDEAEAEELVTESELEVTTAELVAAYDDVLSIMVKLEVATSELVDAVEDSVMLAEAEDSTMLLETVELKEEAE